MSAIPYILVGIAIVVAFVLVPLVWARATRTPRDYPLQRFDTDGGMQWKPVQRLPSSDDTK